MTADTEKASETPRQGIGSLEIGLRILDTIAESPRPLTLKNLSDRLVLSPSRLHKYLVSLLRMGHIVHDSGNSYTLGKSCLTLGVAAIRRIDPIRLAFSAVEALNERSDKTVSVTVWNGQAPLVIKWLDSSYPVAVNIRLGLELSPFYSVSGRIFLANLPHERREAMLEQFFRQPPALPRHGGKGLQQDAFREHLDQVREDNLCCFYGDYLPDLNVAGSAIYDINGNISSVVSLMGMAGDTDITPGSVLQQQLMSCVTGVTEEICGQPQRERHA
jgi:DNA-binding IclR family transcriptional regulator